MEEVGERIRQARLKKGLKIEDVQQATKIRSKYLRAIEEGKFDVISEEVFLKGFLRVYANYVGLDGQEILAEYKRKNNSNIDSGVNDEDSKEELHPLLEDILDLLHRNWKKGVIATLIVVILLTMGIGLYRSNLLVRITQKIRGIQEGSVKKEKLRLKEVKVTSKVRRELNQESKESHEINRPEKIKKKNKNKVKDKDLLADNLNFTIEALEASWVKVVVDGKVVFEKILNSGESKSWHADQKLKLLTSNAAGIRIVSEDRVLGPFGKHGEVIEKEFTLKSK